eukprot:371485-Pyramimonas_sp.AAC.1
MAPRELQEGPNIGHAKKLSRDRSLGPSFGHLGAPRRAQDGPQRAPKGPKEGPKRAPRGPQHRSRERSLA